MDVNTELILIRITGLDRPGLTASFTEILSAYDVTILDIGQADIHSTLSLGILFKSHKSDSGNIMKELLFKASDIGVNIQFAPVSVEEYEEWVNMQGKDRHILTLLGRKLSAKQIAAVTRVLAEQGLNIDAIKRLTGRQPLDEDKASVRACIELSVRGTPRDREEMQREMMRLSSELEMDFSFQRDNMYRRMRRLICFDMDSTLIQTECIDELAERAGVGEQVRAITESAMRGEIDFKESFAKRVALLKGLDESVMKDIAENMPITEGVERLMFVLKRYGYKIAILSGGFTYFGEYLQKKFGIDHVYASELEIIDGKLTGR
jgi:phosphoserine phosphatase